MNIRHKRVSWIIYATVMIISLVNFLDSRGFDRALQISGVGESLEEKGDVQGALKKYEEAVRIMYDLNKDRTLLISEVIFKSLRFDF